MRRDGLARTTDAPRSRRRSAVTLAEVLVVLAVLGIAAAAVSRVGVGQGERYRDFAGAVRARSVLREGTSLFATELRGVAPPSGDLYAGEMRDASIAFRSAIATFALCEPAMAGTSSIEVIVPDFATDTGSSTGPSETPSVGDSLWLYDSGATVRGSDDRWEPALIVSAVRGRRACPNTASGLRDVYRLGLANATHATTESHAPVRVFRRVRYALYQSSDALWYLGYADCRPIVRNPPCSSLQPVSGPYQSYSSANGGARSGLRITYLGLDGRATSDPLTVVAIGIVLRAQSGARSAGRRDAVDSLTIALRNALR